ncbi:hypothetical protein BHE74_00042701 [Ensete ventricosum]|nr:hypothetical protein BHE74_00042701 [Ensete ventricosum]RZS06210.1 hypothetical protein BHM03_00036831 [Ensete ventricosum]
MAFGWLCDDEGEAEEATMWSHRWSSKIAWLWKLQRMSSDRCGKLQREDMDGVCAHMAREGGGEATAAMQLGTVEFCDPSRVGSDACCNCYGRNRVVDEEDGSRGKSRDRSGRQQRLEAGEVAMLGQRWQQEIAVVEASSVMQTTMLAATEGKKGDGSDKEEATLGHMAVAVGVNDKGLIDRCNRSTGDVHWLMRVRLMIAITNMVRWQCDSSKVWKTVAAIYDYRWRKQQGGRGGGGDDGGQQ